MKIKLPLKKLKKNPKLFSQNFISEGKILELLFFLLLYSLLFINLFYSQTLSPLYFSLVNEEKKAAVEFLKKIKGLPNFQEEMRKYKILYGKKIEDEVFAEDRKRKQMIENLEQILEKNPKARDVLYSLSLLYNEDGDKIRAQEYLRRAKEVDPNINIKY